MDSSLKECWRGAQCLLRPQDTRDGAWPQPPAALPWVEGLKPLFWAAAALLAGLCLGQLR